MLPNGCGSISTIFGCQAGGYYRKKQAWSGKTGVSTAGTVFARVVTALWINN
jgi:hypothetical protein